MLTMSMLASEGVDIVGVIDPDAYAANTYTTAPIDMSKYDRIMAICQAGDLGSSATLIAKLQHGAASNLSDAEDVTGKTAATLTQSPDDSNKQVVINMRADEMVGATKSFKNGTSRYARLALVLGTATSDMSGIVLGFHARNGAPNAGDLAAVDEII